MGREWGLAMALASVVAGAAEAAYGVDRPLLGLTIAAGMLGCWRRRSLRVPWILVGIVVVSAGVGWWQMRTVLTPTLESTHIAHWHLPQETMVEGVVQGTPKIGTDRTIVFLVLSSGGPLPGRATTGVVRLTFRSAVAVQPGTRMRVRARLRRPSSFRSPGAFDWVAYLAHRKVFVVGSAREPFDILSAPSPGPTAWLNSWRTATRAAIDAATDAEAAAVLRALVLGDDAGIGPPLRDAFARAGVVHVLSVSGLHLALVAGGAAMVVRWLMGRSERLLLGINVEASAGFVGTTAAVIYGLVAGMEVPTLRSALMVAIAWLATVLGRHSDALRALAIAALAIMVWSPGVEFEAAFQLSFVSVAALLLAGQGKSSTRWIGLVRDALRTSVVASLATAPLTAWHFHQLSVAGPLANLIVIPLFGAVVLAPALLAAALVGCAPTVAHGLFALAGLVIGPATALVRWIAAWPWAAIDVPTPSVAELGAWGGAFVLWFRAPALRGWSMGGAIAVSVAAQIAITGALGSRPLRIAFLDVGQGDAAVVELPDGRVMVIDGGGFPGSDFDVGKAVVLPYLARRRIRRVDTIVVTHPHPDHFAGLTAVFDHHPVTAWWWNGSGGGGQWASLADAAARAQISPLRIVPQAPVAAWPEITVLHPPLDWQSAPNDASVVLRLAYGGASVLFTGDAQAAAEAAMEEGGGLLAATVLKVPHHGSRTSSTAAFLDQVVPRIAVISAGADNRYGLPSPDVEARYRRRGICVLRTDQCGTITVLTDGQTVEAAGEVRDCRCPPVMLRPPP